MAFCYHKLHNLSSSNVPIKIWLVKFLLSFSQLALNFYFHFHSCCFDPWSISFIIVNKIFIFFSLLCGVRVQINGYLHGGRVDKNLYPQDHIGQALTFAES